MEPTGAGEFVRLHAVGRLCAARLPSGARLVDLGGGEGHLERFLPPGQRAGYVVIDSVAEGKGKRVVADLMSLPLPQGSVDALCISDVLEHVPDDRSFLKATLDALRPGGTAIVHVPSLRQSPIAAIRQELEEAESHDHQDFPHVRDGYRADELVGVLEDAAPGSTVEAFGSFTALQSLLCDIDWFLWRRDRRLLRMGTWALVRLLARRTSLGPPNKGSGVLAIVVKAG
jgi:SAM-dependent methyltransferase